jgi:hypothetical protein
LFPEYKEILRFVYFEVRREVYVLSSISIPPAELSFKAVVEAMAVEVLVDYLDVSDKMTNS